MPRSKIEWLQRPNTIGITWSPVTGCSPVSEGCKHCWAKRMANRLRGRFGYDEEEPFQVTLHEDRLEEPLRWRKPRTVFVCSMSDFFHAHIPFEFQLRVLQVIGDCPQHTFIILTKRTDQLEMWEYACGWHPYPNLWLGVSVENQQRADERIPVLLSTPAAVRFVSVEPCLGPVDLRPYLPQVCPVHREVHRGGRDCLRPRDDQPVCLDWIIVGSETGPGARPMHPGWARDLCNQCQTSGTPFFYKKGSDGSRLLDGKEWNEMPVVQR